MSVQYQKLPYCNREKIHHIVQRKNVFYLPYVTLFFVVTLGRRYGGDPWI